MWRIKLAPARPGALTYYFTTAQTWDKDSSRAWTFPTQYAADAHIKVGHHQTGDRRVSSERIGVI